jgi:hypothetical protein
MTAGQLAVIYNDILYEARGFRGGRNCANVVLRSLKPQTARGLTKAEIQVFLSTSTSFVVN